MKQGYSYKDGKVEILDIIDNKEVLLEREYQDNIYEIISLENEIEELNNYKTYLLKEISNNKNSLKKENKDWKILISIDVLVSVIVFIVSLISNYNDLLFIGLEGIVISSNIPALISSNKYKRKIKKETIVNILEISNINNILRDNTIYLNELNNNIIKYNENKLKENNNYIYINNNQEIIKYLNECKEYFINQCNEFKYDYDNKKDNNISVIKYKIRGRK